MKKFNITFLKFIIPFFLVLLFVNIILKKIVSSNCDYKLDKNISTIIIGHSQPEHAFNDSLITNTKNLCSGGEAAVYTYLKLKKISSENPQIKTVLLSFSNNQLEEKMNEWTFSANSMNHYYSKFNFIMNSDDYLLFIENSVKNTIDAEVKSIMVNVKAAYSNKNRIKNSDFGGYMFSKKCKTDSLIKANYIDKIKKEQTKKISKVNIEYLQKIIAFCKEKKLQIILFRTPIHEKLFAIQDEKKFQDTKKQYFDQLPFIDLVHFKLNNDDYGDFSHLNYKGAKKVSVHLNKIIKEKQFND